ncbi:MAG TPA: LysR family transcriptional regulator [Bacillota bacterium]|jgi:DNA-binding transcriptional LysR family regulator|nr:LysR family transcriptional regulator [Fastidiosipila sp.]HPX92675.1 LysR family transcriptional regulator [Bacillota bacterium]HQB81042.1 LysR family transcriptional regulator [Bacillota bacterium]
MIDRKVASLLAVVEMMSFTKAAEILNLTQPAVSQHISQLEKELGFTLFHRGKGAIRLTDAGETVVRFARRLNSLYDRLKTTLSDQDKSLTRLRIGITHTAESNIVAEVLAEYGNRNPGIVITILTDSIKNLYERLDNYDLDLAIVEGAASIPEFGFILLDTDYLVCAMSNEHPLAKNSMVTLEDLIPERMILRLSESATVNLFIASLESINRSIQEFNVILEVDNIATIKDLIRKNLGISILPKSTCADEVSKGKMTILPIENMRMIRETKIVYQKDFWHPFVLQELTSLYGKIANRRNRIIP